MHDRVIHGLGPDHADATHPAGIVERHEILALYRMNERRLEAVRERPQFFRGAVAAVAAHDHDAAGLVDAADDFGNLSALAMTSGCGFKVATLDTPPSAFASKTSCGIVR